MKKRKFKITTIANNNKEEYHVLGIYDIENQRLEYQETRDLLTHVILDIKNKILIRENKDYYLKYQLLENKVTENKMDIKEFNQSMILKIKTEKFTIEDNKVEIIYTLLDSSEKFQYIIEF